MSNRIEISIEDAMDAIIDYRGKTPTKTSSGVPLVTAKIVKGGRIDTPTEFIAEADFDGWMRRGMPKAGDIVITTEAPLGEVAQLDDRRIALAQRLICLRGKPGLLDNDFLKFLLMSSEVQTRITARASGTTVVGIRQSELRMVLLPLPPIEEQRNIAAVLGSLDEKIEQNRRTGSKLEELACAVFKAWFVDFEPVKAKAAGATAFPGMPPETFAALPTSFTDSNLGPVPEGWTVATLDDVLQLQRGFDLPKVQRVEGPYPIYAASGINGWHNEWRVKGPGVTTGRSGVLGNVLFADRDFWPLNTSLWVKEYKRSNPWHAYYFLQTVGLDRFNAGSAVPTLNRNHLRAIEAVMASDDLLNAFAKVCRSLFELQQHFDAESAKLAALRDYLLPRLLSGRVRAKEAERKVSNAS